MRIKKKKIEMTPLHVGIHIDEKKHNGVICLFEL